MREGRGRKWFGYNTNKGSLPGLPGTSSASRGKSDITLQCLVIEALPLQGLITGYNALSTTDVPKTADQYIPA